MEYRTARLILREFTPSDFPMYYQLLSDDRVMRYAYLDPFQSEQAAQKEFAEILASNQSQINRPMYVYAVTAQHTGAFVGMCDIDIGISNGHGGYAEIGYFLRPEHWGNGYATEIATKLIEICIEQLHLHKVIASCNANNTASEHVMQKLGMKLEGRMRQQRWKHEQWEDELVYGLLQEDLA